MTTKAEYEALADELEIEIRSIDRRAQNPDATNVAVAGYTAKAAEKRTIARALRIAAAAEGQWPVAPDGWKLVPHDLTEEMRAAVWLEQYRLNGAIGNEAAVLTKSKMNDIRQRANDESAYRAMLAAAPSPPPAPGYDEGWNAAIDAAAKSVEADDWTENRVHMQPGESVSDWFRRKRAADIRALKKGHG